MAPLSVLCDTAPAEWFFAEALRDHSEPLGVVLNLLDTTPEENPNLVLLIADTVDTIAAMVSDRRRVFVHCVAAENRTPTLAAAWLCRHGGRTADQALTIVARELNEPKPFLREAVRSI